MLAGQQQQQGFNPYSVPAQQIASANVYSPTSSTGANLLAGLIQGTATSIFGDLAQRRQAELNAAAVNNQRALLRQVQEDSLAQDLAKQQQRLGVEPQFQTIENQGQKQTYANYGQGLQLVGQQPIERQKSNAFMDQMGVSQPATFETVGTVGPSATTTPITAESGQGVDSPIDFRSQDAANRYVSKGLAARIASNIPVDANDKKALYEEYSNQVSSLDSVSELARIKSQLDEGINKAGNTGLGLYSTIAEYGDKAAAGFLGAQSSIDRVTGSKLLDQAGSQIAMNYAKDTPGFAKMVDTDPGARLFLGPIKPGSDQTPEVNRQFSEGLGQTIAAKLDKQSRTLGIPIEQLRAQTGTNTRDLDVYFGIKPEETGGQNAGQNQGQDPQAAAVQALNIQETATPSAAPTPAPTSPKEVPFEAYAQTLPKPQETIPYVQKISEGLPEKMDAATPELMQRLFQAESSGNPNAKSKVGAKGLGQLMDATGKEVHKQLGIKEPYDPFNPQQNALIAETYLNQKLKENNGDVKSALAAYNAGQGSVNKAQKKTFSQYAQGLGADFMQGASFGTADEGMAALKAKLGPRYGKSGDYDKYLADERAQLEAFRAENPKAAMAANIAGTYGIGPIVKGVGAVYRGGKALVGAAPSVARMVGLGASSGAAQGFGAAEGGAAERIKGAIQGGVVGGAGAGAIQGAVKGATALAKSDVVSNLAQKIANSSEVGAVGDIGKLKGKQVKEAASKGYQAVYKLLNKSDVSLADLQEAAVKVEKATNKGVPANLVSELAYDVTDKGTIITKNKPLVQRANTLRNTSGATKEATAILEEATSQSPERVKQIVGQLDPKSGDVAKAADKFLEGYKGKVKDIRAARKAAADPLYEAARQKTPTIELPKTVQEDVFLKKALKQVRSDYEGLYDKTPDNDLDLLLKAREYLRDNADAAYREGRNNIGSKTSQAQKALTEAIDASSPEATEAAKVYAKQSKPLNVLEKGTLKSLGVLADKEATPEKIAQTVTNLTTREARQLKAVMGKKYSGEIVAGLKSAILGKLEKTGDKTSDFVDKVIGSESQRKTIKILAGDNAYEDLMSSLAAEKKIVRLGQDTSRGSNTAEKLMDTLGNSEELTTLGKVANVAKSPVKAVGHIADYVGNIVKKSNANTEREVVDLLLKQPQLQDFVNYYGKRQAAELVVDQVGSKASRAGSRTLNSSQVTYKRKK